MAMTPNDDRMHPEDKRNMIIFIVLSLLLWFAYDTWVLQPKLEAQKAARAAVQATISAQQASQNTPEKIRPREEVIAEAQRITVDNGQIFGTLSLTGSRIDDISLHHYFETLEARKEVSVLSPSATPYPKYIESGWTADNIALPGKDTRWTLKTPGVPLSKDSPVTFTWDNGQGIRFERTYSIDDRYLITLTQRAENAGQKPVTLSPYALVTQHGMPQDFTGQFTVHEGPIGYIGKELEERTYKKMAKEQRFTASAAKGWIGITEKYWLGAIIPQQGQDATYRFAYTPPSVPGDKEKYQVDVVGAPQVIKPGEMAEATTHFFIGAKEVKTLNRYESALGIPHLDLAVDFGLFYFLTRPFFWILHTFYGLVGNFGVAILMMTLLLRAAVFPLANTSYKSFAKLRQVSPQMFELRQKYADDKQKLQEELVKLYQKEKVNPAAGCLPILVQIPIFFALFKVLSFSIEMRHQPFFGWIQDLSAPDPTSIFNLFGFIPWTPPSFLTIGVWPCLMLLSMTLQRKLSPPPQDEMQAKMIAIMPYFMTFILAGFASGLVIYWTFSNILSVIQQYVIMKNMGVEPHLFSKDKERDKMEKAVHEGPAVHPSAEIIEHTIEDAVEKAISPPKPKKSKKRK